MVFTFTGDDTFFQIRL